MNANPCVHHWMLPEPNGPTVRGVCRKCHQQRDFPAAGPTGPWVLATDGRLAKHTVPAEEANA